MNKTQRGNQILSAAFIFLLLIFIIQNVKMRKELEESETKIFELKDSIIRIQMQNYPFENHSKIK